MDYTLPGSEVITSLLSLVGVNAEFSDKGAPAVLKSPFEDNPGALLTYLPEFLDNLTTNSSESTPGRLNVNQAPRELLYSVPNMPPEVVEQVIGSRSFEVTADRPERRHAEWMLMDGLVTLEQMKAIAPLVTGGGDVYRAQIVGFFEEEGPMSRIEAVVDATKSTPELLHRLDLTPLGGGFSPEELSVVAPESAAGSP
jgi:hypothetical protein